MLEVRHAFPGKQPQALEHVDLLAPDGLRVEGGRRLHRHQGEDLEDVVLEHVPERPCRVIERSAIAAVVATICG